jgi:hypothetical protein
MQEPIAARPDRQRLLGKLVRELVRSEAHAVEHAARETRRLGECAPVKALREVARHAADMRPRLEHVLVAHGVRPGRHALAGALTALRSLVADHRQDAERAYRGALLDLRDGLDIVRVLHEVARLEELFALIRWCDDWLGARRALVTRIEAQLAWFAGSQRREPPTFADGT